MDTDEVQRALERVIAITLRVRDAETPDEVAAEICDAACETFSSDAAALWRRDGDAIELIRRSPPSELLPVGVHVDLGTMPQLAAHLAAGAPAFVADLAREEPRLWQDVSRALDTRSQLRLPLYAAGASGMFLALSWHVPRESPNPAMLAVARRFADQAAAALADAERRRAESEARELYEQFEAGLLPELDLPGECFAVTTRSAPGEARMRMGGDFLDAVVLDSGELAVLLGDVEGHGPRAAALGVGLRAAWRALVLAGLAPDAVMCALQGSMRRQRPETIATLVACRLAADRRSLAVTCVGHPAPVLIADGRATPLAVTPGPPLGALGDVAWEAQRLELPEEWRLVLYTDGVVEGWVAPGGGERYGERRLLALLERLAPQVDDDGLLDAVLADTCACHGGPLPDDVALVAVSPQRSTPAER